MIHMQNLWRVLLGFDDSDAAIIRILTADIRKDGCVCLILTFVKLVLQWVISNLKAELY